MDFSKFSLRVFADMEDLYKILNVEKNDSAKESKKA